MSTSNFSADRKNVKSQKQLSKISFRSSGSGNKDLSET